MAAGRAYRVGLRYGVPGQPEVLCLLRGWAGEFVKVAGWAGGPAAGAAGVRHVADELKIPAREDAARSWSLIEAGWAPLEPDVRQALVVRLAGSEAETPVLMGALARFLDVLPGRCRALADAELTCLDRVAERKLLLRRTLASYGHDLDGGVSRRLLAWLLLHQYSCLPWYFRGLPRPPEPTLDALADCWFGYRNGVIRAFR